MRYKIILLQPNIILIMIGPVIVPWSIISKYDILQRKAQVTFPHDIQQ